MCGWCSCSFVVFLMVIICLFVGMKFERMFRSVVLLLFVLLDISMFILVCVKVCISLVMGGVSVLRLIRFDICSGLVVNWWIESSGLLMVEGGMMVFICELLGRCVFIIGLVLLM